jgi:hypothetical protein
MFSLDEYTQVKWLLTFDGLPIVKRLFLENPNRSRSKFAFNFSGRRSVIPRTRTGSVGGMALRRPTNVVITFSGKVPYQLSIPGK